MCPPNAPPIKGGLKISTRTKDPKTIRPPLPSECHKAWTEENVSTSWCGQQQASGTELSLRKCGGKLGFHCKGSGTADGWQGFLSCDKNVKTWSKSYKCSDYGSFDSPCKGEWVVVDGIYKIPVVGKNSVTSQHVPCA